MTCKYCGGNTEEHIGLSNHKNEIRYDLCRSCGVAVKPHTQIYDNFTRETLAKAGHSDLELIAKQYTHVADKVAELSKAGTLLDYGCACGGVLKLMKERGFDVEGFDICPVSIEVCRENGFRCSSDLPTGKYDVIWCSETIEHLPEPMDFIYFAADHINPKGIVYIQTQQPALSGEDYCYAYQDAHTVLMTPTFLDKAMLSRGFEVVSSGENRLGCFWRFYRA